MQPFSYYLDTLRLYLRYPQTLLCVMTEARFSFLHLWVVSLAAASYFVLPFEQFLLVTIIGIALVALIELLHRRMHRQGALKNFYGITGDNEFVSADVPPFMMGGAAMPAVELDLGSEAVPEHVKEFFDGLLLKNRDVHLKLLNIYVSSSNEHMLMQDDRRIGIVLPTIGVPDVWHWLYRGRHTETQAKQDNFPSVKAAMDALIDHALRDQWSMLPQQQQPAQN